MKPSSRIWRETLVLAEAGIKPRDWPNECRSTTDGATLTSIGFYKLPRKEPKLNAKGQQNGQWKIVGYEPVAVTIVSGELKIFIGDRDVPPRGEADSSFLSNPMSEEEYREVTEQGLPFREFRAALAAKDAFPDPKIEEQDMTQVDESGVGQIMDAIAEERAAVPPQIDIKRRLGMLKSEAPAFAKIESDEQSSAGRGLQARFMEIRGEAAGHYEQANRPLLEQQKKLREIWFPLRDEADACKTEIGNALGAWEDFKRAAAKRAQDEAEKKQREHEAAVAIAEAANQPAPPPPPEVKPNAPAPLAQIKAPGVRAAKVKLQRIVTEIDVDKAFVQFRGAPEVREVLIALAQRAVNAGLPVDGATIDERSKVS